MSKGKLYLIPSALSDTDINCFVPEKIKERIKAITVFIVENTRTTRRFLKKINKDFDIDSCVFYELNKHEKNQELTKLLGACINGKDAGLITEAGCPGIADPGAEIVLYAQKNNIRVIPLTGPSSITLALMASGMNGQNFAFAGYLPVRKQDRIKKIKEIESLALKTGQTQIFIETPYRNMQMLDDIVNNCNNNTLLCIASDITGKNEFIKTKPIKEWKKRLPGINKIPAIFLIGRNY